MDRNYEQEYNKAFEAAKGLHDAGNALTKKQMEIVFPQLAESGDEKIRKFLIDYFTSYKIGNVATKLNGYRIDDILAYLEKQKYDRMKPIYDAGESFESALEKAWNDYHNGYENVDKLEDDYVECAHAKGFREGYLFGIENQKESLRDFIDDFPYSAEQEEQDWNKKPCLTCDEYKKGYEAGRLNGITAGYNKAMKEDEQKEQKPVVTHGETYRVDTLGTQQVIAGKMPQKPAEWSEEDKENLNMVLDMVKYCSVVPPEDVPSSTGHLHPSEKYKKELTNWLKSLRPVSKEFLQPHWKPSEEQMKALLKVVDKARELHYTSIDGYDGYNELRSLYEQLKSIQ